MKDTTHPMNDHTTYDPTFLNEAEADELFQHCMEHLDFHHGEYNMYGKKVKTPCLMTCLAEEGFDPYKSRSYTAGTFTVFTERIQMLRERVKARFGTAFKYCEGNLYRDGEDYIGAHRDKECKAGQKVVAISLGAARDFWILENEYLKQRGRAKHRFMVSLEHGSLFVMDHHSSNVGGKHCLPKRNRVKKPRITHGFRE